MSLLISTGDAGTIEGQLAADLTGATVLAHLQRHNGEAFTKECTITDPAEGAWSFAYTAEDFDTAGYYRLELEVTYSNGEVQTFAKETNGRNDLVIRVRDQIA